MDAPSIDLQIRDALARGDVRRASQLLVVHHADAVYATCRALVRDRALAEDLSQEAFTKAIAALPTFRSEAQVRTWLLAITRNACLDHLRRTRGPIDERHELDTEEQPSETPPPFELLVRRGDVERGLSVLTETERAIVVLHHAHGVGYPELSGSFGIAEGTLRMRMSRALSKMRQALEESPQAALAPARRREAAAAMPRSPAPAMGAPMPSRPMPAPSMPAPQSPRAPTPQQQTWVERLRAWWQTAAPSAGDTPPPEALWSMPARLRDRLLADLGA